MTAKNMAELQEDKNIPKQSKEDSQMSKPTPTPWKVDILDKRIVLSNDGMICDTSLDDGDVRPMELANAAFIVECCNGYAALQAENAELRKAAKEVMDSLAEYGPSIVPHLMDTDDNAGERLRQAIAKAEVK